MQFAGLFQIVLFVILAVQSSWGSSALVATSAFIGLTDLDALTLSLACSTTVAGSPSPAIMALVAGVLSNTLLKLTVSLVFGRGSFRVTTALVLGVMVLVIVATVLLGSPLARCVGPH